MKEKTINRLDNHDGSMLLSSLITDERTFKMVCALLSEDLFKTRPHKIIINVLLEMYKKSLYVSGTLLKSFLDRKGLLKDSGGLEYIDFISKEVPTVSNIRYYAKLFTNRLDLEKIIKKSIDLGNTETNDIKLSGLSTGFSEIDEKIAELESYGLIIIASRPDMGKSNLAYKTALHNLVDKRVPTAIFSYAFSRTTVIDYMVKELSRVFCSGLRLGELLEEEKARLINAAALLFNRPLFIECFSRPDDYLFTVANIKKQAQFLCKNYNVKLLLIDSLQSINIKNKKRALESLSHLAKELGITIILLSSLKRNLEYRVDKRPRLNDLRGAEEYGDLVLFLYRDSYYDENGDRDAEIIIAKDKIGYPESIKIPCMDNSSMCYEYDFDE